MTNLHIISTTDATWRRGKKTKNIKAKPVITLIVDRNVVNKFLVNTLEANEPVDAANIFCIGSEVGEPWQQSSKALLKKYTVVGIDVDGWMDCQPLPENEVEFFISAEDGHIVGLWGQTIGEMKNLQKVRNGDTIARQTYDHNDQWVVNKVLWEGTYSELPAIE